MKLHVVSFQVPWPADYGGAIDVYYRLKALKEEGFDVVLHTYIYNGRQPAPELAALCSEVHYYERRTGWRRQFSMLPYIVRTRDDERLLDNLCTDQSPILFEGLHTCFFLGHPRLKDRRKYVRMHNVEHDYYWGLARQDRWTWRALYYALEGYRLRRFEPVLSHADTILAITKADMQSLSSRLPGTPVLHMPVFFDTNFPTQPYDTEPFALFHGNLSVPENQRIVRYILRQLAPRCPGVLFVIAGRDPKCGQVPRNVKVVANPTDEYLDQLLQTARIHLMLTFQSTGIKLKLLNALVRGSGHVIANRPMLYGHSLGRFCTRADSTPQIIDALNLLIKTPQDLGILEYKHKVLTKLKKAGISRLSLFK